MSHDAVLLAGGRASRLGGLDKTALGPSGHTLFDRAVAAASGAEQLVVVGLRDGPTVPPGAIVTREDPPFSGPASALAAGLVAISRSAPSTLVLACDLVRPREAVDLLFAAAAEGHGGSDGFVAVDEDGRRQPLLALYRSAALHAAVRSAAAQGSGLVDLSLRRLTAPLDLAEVPMPSALCADVDTPDDAERLT